MSRINAVWGLMAVTLLGLGVAHRYKGPEYRQTKTGTGYVDEVPEWSDSHGYEECEDFKNDPAYNENYEEGAFGKNADNELHHLLNRHLPQPIDKICTKYECPAFKRIDSEGCGFETVIIPRGYWMVSDIDLTRDLGVREAYKRLYRYRSGRDNDRKQKMNFVVPILKKYFLDQDSNVERAVIGMYIPEAYQNDPPKSTFDEVRVEEWDEATVYVRPFGGYREETEFDQQFDLLKLALEKVSITPNPKVKVVAGYTYLRYGRQRIEAMLYDESSEA